MHKKLKKFENCQKFEDDIFCWLTNFNFFFNLIFIHDLNKKIHLNY